MQAGAKIGANFGPVGAVAGAALGAVYGAGIAGTVAGVGAAKDRDWLERQQTEARSFAVDNFNYQLGNVQALNPTITKSTPFTYNNKVWPILEYYTCTNDERNVMINKIKYDGMTIMAIGTLNSYSNSGAHLQGKMIRLNNLNDDSHIANAIYEEVAKGFYIPEVIDTTTADGQSAGGHVNTGPGEVIIITDPINPSPFEPFIPSTDI